MGNKLNGEITEVSFCLKVLSLGHKIALPYGDSSKYDVIVDTGRNLYRVQIKSTRILEKSYCHSRYRITVGHGRTNKKYSDKECDLVAMHVYPLDIWYIMPINDVSSTSIGLYPHIDNSRGKYETYREQWGIFV